MSYFFGTIETSGSVKSGKKKNNRHKSLSNARAIGTLHGLRHGRKHSTSKTCILKPKSVIKDSLYSCRYGNNSAKKSKSKYFPKNLTKVVEENSLLTTKLDETESDLNNLSDKKRDELLLRLKRRCQKLEQRFREMLINRDNIKILMVQQENDFRQLRIHHEKSMLFIKNFQEERNNLMLTMRKLKTTNIQLNEDLNLLKNLIYHLNVVIEECQDKLRTSCQNTEKPDKKIIFEFDEDFNNKNIFNSWGRVTFHALGPLLDAYQENLNEKDDLIQKYKIELDDFSNQVKEVIAENEYLYIKLRNLKMKHEKYIEEMRCFKKDTAIVKEENSVLVKQLNFQKQKAQEIHALYEQKVKSMSQDNNKLHKEYIVHKTELSSLKGKYEILSRAYEDLKNNSEKTMPVTLHNNTTEESKRLFEELKQQYETEKKTLDTRIKYLEEIQLKHEKQLIVVTTERNELRLRSTNLQKNLKQTHRKLENIKSFLYSIQISLDTFKQQLNKITSYCQEVKKKQEKLIVERKKLSYLLEERKKEKKDIKCQGTNIVGTMCTLKNQSKSPNCELDTFNVYTDAVSGPRRYCGNGNFSKESNGKEMIITLTTSVNSLGGTFRCFFQAVEEEECRCGWKKPTKIVGGKETGINEYPMMVGVINVPIQQVYCGGTIISPRFILTAAHCLNGLNADQLGILVGDHDLTTGLDTNATKLYQVVDFKVHPLYVTNKRDYDIAVISIAGAITFTNEVGPACLPFQHYLDSFGGSMVDVLGWGTTEFAGAPSDTLQQVKVSVTNFLDCKKFFNDLEYRQICTFSKGMDACQFDSGGPVLWQNPTTRRLVHVGIISYGSFCASEEPAVNTRVGSFISWILEVTPGAEYCRVE